jgi:hypothetical protein
MGGTDDQENLVFLTPEEHAKAHQELYEKYGKMEDYLAWKGLAGFMGREEIITELMRENGKRVGNNSYSKKIGIHDPNYTNSSKYKEMCSKNGKILGKKMAESGHCKRVAPLGGGKNLGKNSWFNPVTGKETQAFNSPGEDWIKGVNMDRVNVEFLRENSDNVKGTYWISNKETGETRMIFPEDEIPEGFDRGRIFSMKNLMDLHNTSDKSHIEGIPQVSIEFSYIIFNPGNSRWEFSPTINKKRLIKISHTDYYGLVWARDCYLNLMKIEGGRSKFNFTANSVDEIQTVLKDWREYFRTIDILSGDKLKKFRRERYEKKLESLKENYNFLEETRNKITN